MSAVHLAFAAGLISGATLSALAVVAVAVRSTRAVQARAETIGPHTYQAIVEITAERVRQVGMEGFSPDKDDQHTGGALALAAMAYAHFAARATPHRAAMNPALPPPEWPWSKRWWKPETPRRALVKAGALIVAEIERLDRQASTSPSIAA